MRVVGVAFKVAINALERGESSGEVSRTLKKSWEILARVYEEREETEEPLGFEETVEVSLPREKLVLCQSFWLTNIALGPGPSKPASRGQFI